MRFLVLLILLSKVAIADDDVVSARENLKKWGLAYCLHQNMATNTAEFGAAQNAYFQLGGHNDEKAYQNIKAYFDAAYKSNSDISSSTGKPIVLMRCLQAYEAKEYRKLIAAQDKYAR